MTQDIELTRDKMILEILEMLNFEIWVQLLYMIRELALFVQPTHVYYI